MLRPIQFVFAYIHNNTGFVSERGTLEIPHPTEIWVISLELFNEKLEIKNEELGIATICHYLFLLGAVIHCTS